MNSNILNFSKDGTVIREIFTEVNSDRGEYEFMGENKIIFDWPTGSDICEFKISEDKLTLIDNHGYVKRYQRVE